MSRILGVDYGKVRTGLAITDELGITAQGLYTINSNGSDKVVLREIEKVINDYDNKIEKIVVGYPISLDGSKTIRTEETELFIHKLKSRFNKIEIIKVDERLTTVEAHKTMNLLEINNRKKKEIVDTISAVYILESYINKK